MTDPKDETAPPEPAKEKRRFSWRTSSHEPLIPAKAGETEAIPIRREELAAIMDPRSQIAEQFRGLRNSIHALNPDGASHTLVLTSALRGEGKTVACINLAIAMAELPGKQVLIVDADLHHPAVEEYLGVPARQGLVEVLRGKLPIDQAIRRTSVSGVSVIGAGEPPPNPSELLGSDRMRSVMNRLKQSYSYVLIDTPEAMTISDASLLGAVADGILLVVRLGETPRHYVEQTHNNLEALGGNVLGTCLTGAKIVNSSEGYARR
ncbi:MAG: polysaccharide biosynthesis tyrosine autokinase [Planctomycetota bacterium]|nr:MAG: polysaccharide biosynthesis tyrosine autokinase [Planctomycetota bacterium]